MSEGHAKPRRFRFTLRTLFVVVTVIGCWLGYELNWIRQRHALLEELVTERASLSGQPSARVDVAIGTETAPGLLRLFSERGVATLYIHSAARDRRELTAASLDEQRRVQGLFPEAHVRFYYSENGDCYDIDFKRHSGERFLDDFPAATTARH